MTLDSGVYSHHSSRGANFLMSHKGTDRATSQKNGAINPPRKVRKSTPSSIPQR